MPSKSLSNLTSIRDDWHVMTAGLTLILSSKTEIFTSIKFLKNLDLSHETDLDIWELFGSGKIDRAMYLGFLGSGKIDRSRYLGFFFGRGKIDRSIAIWRFFESDNPIYSPPFSQD